MNTFNRNGNRWTVNELLSLQREYELLEWTIQQIAVKHQRTERAILFKLGSEGFVTSWNNARGFDMESYKASFEDDSVSENYVSNEEDEDCEEDLCDNNSDYDDVDEDTDDDTDDTSEVERLSERIWSLETAVTDIKDIVQQMFNSIVSNNNRKLTPLRKPQAEEH